jgi:dihydrofolate reductase
MGIMAIVAMAENRVIGHNKQLPWHMPADLQHFKTITMGKPIIMGRHTYQSIGRPLPGRLNVVITRDPEFHAPGCVVVYSIASALEAVSYSDDVFIIGGASLFEHAIPRLQRIYLTIIHHEFDGDTHFPELDMTQWKESDKKLFPADEKNPYAYTFVTLDRVL